MLQRGLVTLDHLKVLGAYAIALEFMIAGALGPGPLTALGLAFGFSLLMKQEFFIKEWLRRRLVLYACTHMLIMPLLAVMIFSFTTGLFPWQAPGWFWLYGFVGFFVGFNWEISRKIRAPSEEREGVDSYTKSFGTYGAAYAVLAVRVIDTAMVSLVGYHLGLGPWFYAALAALFCVCLAGFLRYRFATSPRTARQMEIYAGMYVIAFDLTLAVAIARTYGVTL